MSKYVDETIVSMKFDGKQFSNDIDKVIKDLELLKKTVKMDGMGKGLQEIGKSVKDIKFDDVNKSANVFTNLINKISGKNINDVSKSTKDLKFDDAAKGAEKLKNNINQVSDKNLKEVQSTTKDMNFDKVGNSANKFKDIIEKITGKQIKEVGTATNDLKFDKAASEAEKLKTNVDKITDKNLKDVQKTSKDINFKEPNDGAKTLKERLSELGSNTLDKMKNAIKTLTFDSATKSCNLFKDSLSALEVVGVGALMNIGTKISDMGMNFAKSITVEPVMDGFREYETQMNSIQTILANTSHLGTTMGDVTEALDDMNTYADKTIYNFTEMTKNIGTFTAAGLDLKTSKEAIKGIANLAAVSGSNSEQASRAMYQLSQALAAGVVNLQDWNSVVNAGMGGKVFQDALKRTAKNMGMVINEEQSFRESIGSKDGTAWLTGEVLAETLRELSGEMTDLELKSLGYTDDQVKEIQKLADTAVKAATEVKTLSALWDTMKEAVGSGWAQTWKIVVGDFLEAKDLFTSISNWFSDITNDSANARNSVLQDWKDKGGRDDLLSGLADSAKILLDLIDSLKNAWHDIFPQATSDQLLIITACFKEWSHSLMPSEQTLNNLRSTLGGLFSILSIGKTVLVGIINGFAEMGSGAGYLASVLLEGTASIGEWFKALNNMIKETDIANNIFKSFGTVVGNLFYTAGDALKYIGTRLSDFRKSVEQKYNVDGIGLIGIALESVSGFFKGCIAVANDFRKAVTDALNWVYKGISDKFGTGVVDVFSGISKTLSSIIEGVAGGLKKAGELFNFNLKDFLDTYQSLALSTMILRFSQAGKTLKTTIEDIGKSISGFFDAMKKIDTGSIIGVFKQFFSELRETLETIQKSIKADTLLKISIAIGILAASMNVVASLDVAAITRGSSALAMAFSELLAAAKIYSSFIKLDIKGTVASTMLVIMATALLLMADTMKKMGDMDWGQITRGLTAMGICLAELVVATAAMNKLGTISPTKVLSITILAGALKILASDLKDLSALSWDDIGRSLSAMGGILGELALFSLAIQKIKISTKDMLSLTILAGALKILGNDLKDLSTLSWDDIGRSLTTMLGVLGEVALFTGIMNKIGGSSMKDSASLVILGAALKVMASALADFGNINWEELKLGLMGMAGVLLEVGIAVALIPKDIAVIGAGLIIVGGALKILASSLQDFGTISWDEIGRGLVAMAGALGEVCVFFRLLPTDLLLKAAGLAAVSVSLEILASAFKSFGSITWEQLGIGLLSMGLSLTELVVAIQFLQYNLAGVLTLGTLALALQLLVPPLIQLGQQSWTELATGLLGLAGALGIMIGACVLAAPAAVGIAALAASLLTLGAAVALIGAGVAGIGYGLKMMSEAAKESAEDVEISLTDMLKSAGEFVKTIIDGIPYLIGAVVEAIIALLQTLADNAPKFVDSVSKILKSLIDLIVQNAPEFCEAAMKILSALLDALINWAPTILGKVTDLLIQLIQTIASKAGEITSAAVDLIVAFINGIASKLGDVVQAGIDLTLKFINGIADGIRSNTGPMLDACQNLVTAFCEGIGQCMGKLPEIGINMVKGVISGLKQGAGSLLSEASSLGSQALASMKSTLGIKSPSREFAKLGKFSDMGFAKGMIDNVDTVINASKQIGNTALDNVRNSLKNLTSRLNNENLNNELTLTPVLDLSQVQNGITRLSDMTGKIEGLSIGTSVDKASIAYQDVKTDFGPARSISGQLDTNMNKIRTNSNPTTIQLMLNDGRVLAEAMVKDTDELIGNRTIMYGRRRGLNNV